MGRLTISTPSALLALAAPKTPTTTLFLMPELGKTILLTCAPIPQSSLSAQTPLFRTFAPNKWVQEVSSYSSPSSIPPSPSSSIQHTQPPPLTTPLSAISSPPSFSFITVTADDPSPLPKICLSPALADPPPRGAKKKKDVADVELVYILVVQGRSAGLRA
ncbi:hypothetical protein MMC06_003304, partial [Schaereria dolodes]|nr:hypothetical protein [Schaereria dolodes]